MYSIDFYLNYAVQFTDLVFKYRNKIYLGALLEVILVLALLHPPLLLIGLHEPLGSFFERIHLLTVQSFKKFSPLSHAIRTKEFLQQGTISLASFQFHISLVVQVRKTSPTWSHWLGFLMLWVPVSAIHIWIVSVVWIITYNT